MKITFVIKALDGISGGAERVLASVASGLAQRGHDVSVISFDTPGSESFYPLDPKIERICLGIGDVKSQTTQAEFFIRMKKLRTVLTGQKPDIVIPFMHSSFVPAAFALIGSGIPIIASEHIVPEHYKTRQLQYALLCFSSLFVQKMTVISNAVKQAYPTFLRQKMIAVPNPVIKANKPANVKGEGQFHKTILNVGRLTEQKNQAGLIKAFAKLAPDYPDWRLRIVGEGELHGELERLISDLGMEGRIELSGAIANIGSAYETAQIFVMPSIYESFGLATAEAMAHGLPVMGFADCPGTNELIEHKQNGLLVESNDRISSLKQALATLITNPDLRKRYGEAGIKTAAQFGLDPVLDAWESLAHSVLSDNRKIK